MIRDLVNQLNVKYKGFAEDLKDALVLAIASTSETNFSDRNRVNTLISKADQMHAQDFVAMIDLATKKVVDLTRSHVAQELNIQDVYDVEMFEFIAGRAREVASAALREISLSQIVLDMNFVRGRFSRFLTNIEILKVRESISLQDAIRREKFSRMEIDFTRADALGRKWSTFHRMNVHFKDGLTNLRNDVLVDFYKSLGMKRAYVWNPDGTAHGSTFLLDNYEAMKLEVFHPNSFAEVILVMK